MAKLETISSLLEYMLTMPSDFYLSANPEAASEVASALVSDLFWDWQGKRPAATKIQQIKNHCQLPNYGALAAALCWLLRFPLFSEDKKYLSQAWLVFERDLADLAGAMELPWSPSRFEELVRFLLRQFQLVPADESPEIFEMAWLQISSAQAQWGLEKLKVKRARAQAIEEALVRAQTLAAGD